MIVFIDLNMIIENKFFNVKAISEKIKYVSYKDSNAIRFYSHACDGHDARSGHGPYLGVSDVLS